jgi:hypothetical protein
MTLLRNANYFFAIFVHITWEKSVLVQSFQGLKFFQNFDLQQLRPVEDDQLLNMHYHNHVVHLLRHCTYQ